MDKIRKKLRDLSILSAFILLAIAFLLLTMLVEIEKTLLTDAQRAIAFQYSEIIEGFNSEKVWGNILTAFCWACRTRIKQVSATGVPVLS